jgi:pilus assembly protein Flp/PilA
MVNYLRALLTARLEKLDERGASAVEYGLLVAGIAIVIIAAVFLLGGKIKDMFQNTSNCIGNASVASTCS